MLSQKDWTAELAAALDAHPDVPLVIEGPDGVQYEIEDCTFENVDGRDQTLLVIVPVGRP